MQNLLAALILVMAATLGVVVRKRKPDAPSQTLNLIPQQLNRKDFVSPEKPWLLVVFTSSTCDACQDVATKAKVLTSQDVAVQIIDYLEMRNLHKQYAIDSVPTTVIADNLGVVQYGVLGPITATDLWAAMARCRDPKVLTD
ncbi:MAG: thioredoxin domain-containing protein [Actinomycetota bacterium]|nr:thioredoxin domain-containing protein [Actinomycetota bacterium]